MRYLAQRYTMPYKECKATLTDIGTEELAHLEMICAIVYQLTRNMTMEQIKESGFDTYYVDHTAALWPSRSPECSGIPPEREKPYSGPRAARVRLAAWVGVYIPLPGKRGAGKGRDSYTSRPALLCILIVNVPAPQGALPLPAAAPG